MSVNRYHWTVACQALLACMQYGCLSNAASSCFRNGEWPLAVGDYSYAQESGIQSSSQFSYHSWSGHGICARGCASSPAPICGGATGERMPCSCGRDVRSTARRSNGCGGKRTCACPPNGASAAAWARLSPRPSGYAPSARARCKHWITSSTATATGRSLKILHLVDEFTRELLADLVTYSIDADATVAVLDTISAAHEFREFLRCDNGPELTAAALGDWCRFTRWRSLASRRRRPTHHAVP